MGKRGMHHAAAFQANPPLRGGRASATSIRARLDDGGGRSSAWSRNGDGCRAALSGSVQPDVFCFCTLPHVRLPLIQAGDRERRPADRLSRSRSRCRAPRRFEIREVGPGGGREGGGQPPAPLRRSTTRRSKEIIASGALGRVHTVYGHRDRLDDAHDHPPDRLHALVQRRRRGRVGDGARPPAAASSPTCTLRPTTSRAFIQFANGVRGVHRVRRRRAGRARGRLLVAQVPHRRAGHRRLRRGAHRRRLARGHPARRVRPARAA